MHPISPCLWFDQNAEEAVAFYLSVFPGSRILGTTRYSEGAPAPAGSVMTIDFEINGSHFTALNGGPYFSFSPAISFVIHCDDQAEIDYYWERLRDGGKPEPCGWIKDRFGVSWQLVPVQLMRLLEEGEQARIARMTTALLQMQKLDLAALLTAYHGDATIRPN
jgi:predicted 3-demethylubiquinone-9 3-methyltransferase (glyoxalase superfamily)